MTQEEREEAVYDRLFGPRDPELADMARRVLERMDRRPEDEKKTEEKDA